MNSIIRRLTLLCLLFIGLLQLLGCDSPSLHNTGENAPNEAEISGFESSENLENNAEINSETLISDSENKEKIICEGLEFDYSLELDYASKFSVDYYKDGFCVINVLPDEKSYLVVPEGMEAPEGVPENYIILKRPVKNIYLVASAAMDMFVGLDSVNAVKFSGQKEENWYIEEAREAMKNGEMVYAGKYSKPDYETILNNDCNLVIENTMIYHSPEVLEQFEKFEIPVIVDYSSYENHPLGRVEWIKFYGALLGEDAKAAAIFDEEEMVVKNVESTEKTDKTVAYFYVTSNNLIQVKETSDYIPKMIEMAGGKYIFENLGDDSDRKTTVNMQIEEFYNSAGDADYLIYNSSIDGEVESIDELLKKCPFLSDFKAVKEGNVWCTSCDMYQQSLSIGYMTEDIHKMLMDDEEGMHYIFKVK